MNHQSIHLQWWFRCGLKLMIGLLTTVACQGELCCDGPVLYCTVLYCTVLRARVSYDVMVRATRRENWYPATLRASLRRPANHGADTGHVTTADQSQAAAATSHIRCPNSKNFKHIYFNTSIISAGEPDRRIESEAGKVMCYEFKHIKPGL